MGAGVVYAVYGKRTKEWFSDKENKTIEPDKTFRALNSEGIRVNKLDEALIFASKEDAQEWMESKNFKDGVLTEVRKLK